MAKNIIVLSDGTGNSAAKFNKTNVWRTYEALDLSDPKKQIAYYDDGVGTSTYKPLALLTGAIGLGLSSNVRQLYAFLCRNYEPGDRIYGFGFSRGAFTIRMLASFVARFGLIKKDAYDGERDLWKKTTWLYQAYRKMHIGIGMVPIPAIIIRGLRDGLATKNKNFFLRDSGKSCRSVDIEFLGLWDTVDAYGLPIEELFLGWDRFVWPLSLPNYDLSPKVKKAVHALSLDDERDSFHPLLWNEEGEYAHCGKQKCDLVKATDIKQEHVTQVWFAGMHADVGGGYPDDFLSYVPLNFVLEQLDKLGEPKNRILFDQNIRKAQRKATRIPGVMHNSRSGLQSYYRYCPRKLEKLIYTARSAIQLSRYWLPKPVLTGLVRIQRPKIHHSVFDRIAVSGLRYSPIVLPKHYAVVMPGGKVESLGNKTFEKSAAAAKWRARAQERVWDIAWWRRVTYFSTLFLTVFLALLPLPGFLSRPEMKSSPSETIDVDRCIESFFCPLGSTIQYLGSFLPSYANSWVQSFSRSPGLFMFFSLFILALTHISTHLDGKIRDRMHSIWHPDPARSLDSHYSLQYKFTESVVNRIWERAIRNGLQPTLFGLFALAAIGLTILSVTSRIYFSIADSYGVFCSVDVKTRTTAIGHYYSGPLTFDPSNVCWPTGILVEKGATYRLVINIADTMGSWKDGKLEADLQGNLEDYSFWPAISAWPAKRYPWEKYYKPIARIRTHAPRVPYRDEYVLNPTFLSSKKRYDCLVSDFMAQSSGELFLFVNDAIIYFLPNTVFGTYQNNGGKAEVFVKRIVIAGEPFALPENMATTSACQEFVSSQPQRVSILDQ